MTTASPATANLVPLPTLAERLPASFPLPIAGETVPRPSRLAGLFVWWTGFVTSVREFVKGEIPLAMIGERRGYFFDLCAICGIDIHDTGEVCPRALSAQCDICGVVELDRYMCCPNGKSESHHIIKSTIKPRRQRAADSPPAADSSLELVG